MTRENMVDIIKVIIAAYPSSKIAPTSDTVNLWTNMLKDIPDEILIEAVNNYIAENKYAPTIADIRASCVDMVAKANGELTADEAWGLVLKAIGKFGYVDPKGALEWLPDDVSAIADNIGWRNICETKESEVTGVRGQFMKSFTGRMERKRKEMLTPAGFSKKLAELAATYQQNQLTEGAEAE